MSGKLFNPKDIPDRFRDCFIEVEVQCGAPWERIVEITRTFESGSGKSGIDPIGKNGPALQGGGETGDIRRGPVIHSTSLGWQPGCDCGGMASGVHVPLSPVPCVCLDPFMGSGTVAEVAAKLGRNWLGIELNPKYIELAQERLGLFAEIRA